MMNHEESPIDVSRRLYLKCALGVGILGGLAACGKSRSAHKKLPRNATVLALGDSLTAGYGAANGADYPKQLAQLTGWNVINAGVSGDTSEQALSRLPELLTADVKLALVGIGGNDFLRKIPESETRNHIEQMMTLFQAARVPVVLLAEPHLTAGALFGAAQDHPMYAELAKQYDGHGVILFSDVWSEILSQPKLKSDMIHANEQGYRYFAEKLADFLKKQGFW